MLVRKIILNFHKVNLKILVGSTYDKLDSYIDDTYKSNLISATMYTIYISHHL